MHKNKLDQYYFIKDFNQEHLSKLSNKIKIIIRNYRTKNIEKLTKKVKKFSKKNGFKLYLSNNVKLAIKFGLNGVYIPSFNKSMSHNSYNLKKDFEVIGSAHNVYELNIKKKQGVKTIFFSPVYKKKKKILGIFGFLKLSKLSKVKNIALGGVNKNNLNQIKNLKIAGFAAINHFKKKAPL